MYQNHRPYDHDEKDRSSQMTDQLDGIFENFIWGQEKKLEKEVPKAPK